MRQVMCVLLIVCGTCAMGGVALGQAQDDVYYARCKLKVLEANEMTWINWQAAPTFVPGSSANW